MAPEYGAAATFDYRMQYLRDGFPGPVEWRGLTAKAVRELLVQVHACYGWYPVRDLDVGPEFPTIEAVLERLEVHTAFCCQDERYFTLRIKRVS